MHKHSENTDIKVVAIDLARQWFQLYCVEVIGRKVMGKKLSRIKLEIFMAKPPRPSQRRHLPASDCSAIRDMARDFNPNVTLV